MLPFIELGVEYFTFGCSGLAELITLRMMVGEVLPPLNESG